MAALNARRLAAVIADYAAEAKPLGDWLDTSGGKDSANAGHHMAGNAEWRSSEPQPPCLTGEQRVIEFVQQLGKYFHGVHPSTTRQAARVATRSCRWRRPAAAPYCGATNPPRSDQLSSGFQLCLTRFAQTL